MGATESGERPNRYAPVPSSPLSLTSPQQISAGGKEVRHGAFLFSWLMFVVSSALCVAMAMAAVALPLVACQMTMRGLDMSHCHPRSSTR